ncbi:MAG: flagellar basal body-associated FliL family protein [Ignavibacteriales bacterium]|nr:flagellar basal body-associated FliL family protein [Ignavibacteriales bacterium]
MEKLEEEKPVVKTAETLPPVKVKKGFNFKILIFGIPLFIIQLVAVYFITANILLTRLQANNSAEQQLPAADKEAVKKEEPKSVELGKHIYMVDDLIINPANTDGKRLLLSSLGFDVASEQNTQELKAKEVLLKDAIISVVSSKGMSQLGNIAYRDSLRTEITKRVNKVMPEVKINTIYFSKYILQ